MRRHGWSVRALGAHQLDARGLPSWMTFTRGAGSWSRQTAPAVNGTTFIELGTAQNTPRFDYDPTSGRLMFLVEPTRVNLFPSYVDTTPSNDNPDGWTLAAGTPGVDATIDDTASPAAGPAFHRLNTAALIAFQKAVAIADPGTYVASAWVTATGLGAGKTATMWGRAGVWSQALDLTAGTYAWTRLQAAPVATPGTAGDNVYLFNSASPGGTYTQAQDQLEAGDCASSYVSGTRAAELCAIDPSVVGRSSGYVSLLWRPDFASTASLTVDPALFAWAPNWELLYDPADDKLKVMVNGTKRAASAALSFARQALLRVTVRYSSAGQQLTVMGGGVSATYTDSTSWGTPTLAPYLGSRAASANCRPSAYGDLLLAA